ncbi:MAG: HEPN domain-containing protein, partial [Thermofilum sp.]|nr:HEPN domain-containing protein [Thermofilum sp.]
AAARRGCGSREVQDPGRQVRVEEARRQASSGSAMTLKINPRSEIEYRMRLALRYLEDAEEAYGRWDYRGAVASSQLAAENAAKAVVAV